MKKRPYAIQIRLDLVVLAENKDEITYEKIFKIAKEQLECFGPGLESEAVKIKVILSKEDIPYDWEGALPWDINSPYDGPDIEVEHLLPSPLEALGGAAVEE